jgi:hypothetical protein
MCFRIKQVLPKTYCLDKTWQALSQQLETKGEGAQN